MDTIKIVTVDGWRFTYLGVNTFKQMVTILHAMPATFFGTVKEYGRIYIRNEWEVPYHSTDVQNEYGPFSDLARIAYCQYESLEHIRVTEDDIASIASRQLSDSTLARFEAYRAGRNGEPMPDVEQFLQRVYLLGCEIRLETDLYLGKGEWTGTWRRNVNTSTYQMPLPERRILTVASATMQEAIRERINTSGCTLEEAYHAEFGDIAKWTALIGAEGVYIIDIAADEANLQQLKKKQI